MRLPWLGNGMFLRLGVSAPKPTESQSACNNSCDLKPSNRWRHHPLKALQRPHPTQQVQSPRARHCLRPLRPLRPHLSLQARPAQPPRLPLLISQRPLAGLDSRKSTMPLKLYFAPGACSFVPHVLLELSGAEFEPCMVKLHKGEQNSEDYKAINPRGQVPVLVHDGQPITQILAIALHLDQLFAQQGFLPAEPMARAKALSTLAWMNNTVHPTFTHIFMPQKFSDQPEVHAALKSFNTGLFRGMLAELQAMVVASDKQGHPWLGGARIGALDAYSLTLTRWGTIAGITPEEHPDLWRFVQKVAAEPAVARVIERERLQLNMGAKA